MFEADSLHAGLRAPEPTLSRGERVGPAPLRVACLARVPPPFPRLLDSLHPVHLERSCRSSVFGYRRYDLFTPTFEQIGLHPSPGSSCNDIDHELPKPALFRRRG